MIELVRQSLDNSAVTDLEYAKALIKYSESVDEQRRRALVSERRQILSDDWSDLLLDAIDDWVLPVTRDAVVGRKKKNIDTSINPARHIWRDLAGLYRSNPQRKTEDPADAEKYSRLINEKKFNSFWSTVNLILESCNDVIVWPVVVDRNGKKEIQHRWAAGDTVTVRTGVDPTVIESIVITTEQLSDDVTKYDRVIKKAFWSDMWHGMFDRAGDPIGVGVWENPYGKMPFVFIHRNDVVDGFWDSTGGKDLVDLTINVGKLRTFTNYMWKMSSHKQMVWFGDGANETKEQQILDPSAVIRTTASGVMMVDWQVDFEKRRKYVDDEISQAAASYGINPEFMSRSSSYSSLLGARLAERGLTEHRMNSAKIFESAEQEYYKMVCMVANRFGLGDVPNPNAILDVEHAAVEYPEDPKQQLAYTKDAISLGIKSLVELVRQQHPTWTMDRAEKYIFDNIDVNARIATIRAERNIPVDLANQSRTAEQNGAMGPVVRDANKEDSATASGETAERDE